jgi:hypothetical protein
VSEISTSIGNRPKLDWVDCGLIDVDHNYQRDVDGRSVEKILANFRWDHFGAVVLAQKPDGRFNVTDGQHRVKAAQLHPLVTHVPALIIALEGTAGEAENFLVINRARRAVSTIEIYWAGIASEDPHTLRIKSVLDQAGCEVCAAHGEYRPGHTMAVTAVGRAITRYGDSATVDALKTIRAAWPKDSKSLRGSLITALARIFRASDRIDHDRLIKVLAPKSFVELTAHAEAFRKLSGGSADTVLARTITELYNKGLSANIIYFGEAA